MSDWTFLNKSRVGTGSTIIPERYWTTETDGFNGMFRIYKDGWLFRCVASDGSGAGDDRFKWQHVSVSIENYNKPPSWKHMCWIKDLFWEPEDVVVQYHPAKSEYVNFHPNCLHLWRPLIEKMPVPLSIMVGPNLL